MWGINQVPARVRVLAAVAIGVYLFALLISF